MRDCMIRGLMSVFAITLALAVGGVVHAGDGTWTLRLEPVSTAVHGHDQHVLTIHEVDLDGSPQTTNRAAVLLETEDDLAFRGELQYTRSTWGCGIDVSWFTTSQLADSRDRAADSASGAIDEVWFEIADRVFASSGPDEVLFYEVLEDTAVAVWTADLYAIRALTGDFASGLQVRFGLRVGDFDNDYRAVVGIRDVAGSRLDASSNYDLMMGPMVGLSGAVTRGRGRIEGYLGQSVLLGSVELTGRSREFTGPFGDAPAFFNDEVFSTEQDVAIPITELRLGWTYTVSRMIALGVGANASAWWDVPVPPGVKPVPGGATVLHENTIVFFGLAAAIELTF